MTRGRSIFYAAAIAVITLAAWVAMRTHYSRPVTSLSESAESGVKADVSTLTVPKSQIQVATINPQAPASSDFSTKYRQSANLAAFISEAKPAARNGDGKAARLISEAYAECAGVGKDSNEYVTFMMGTIGKTLADDSKREAFKNALTSEAARCADLNSGQQLTGLIQYWSGMAVKEGDLTSKVSQILPLNNNHVTTEDVQNLVSQAVAAKDSDAIARLGGVMAMGDSQEVFGKFSGQETSSYVWQLASCSFGADCSNTGSLLKSMCLMSGRCGYATLDDAYSEIFSPIVYDRIVQQQNSLVSALQQGSVSAIYHQ